MNLRETILEKHTREQMLRIVDYVGNSKKRFDELMNLFLYDEYRVTQRASWAVSHCIQRNPAFAEKYLPLMLDNLQNTVHDAVLRNTVRILDTVKLPEELHGRILDICYEYIASNTVPVAVKAYSISIMGKLSRQYPELKTELKSLLEDQLPHAKPAILSKAKKIKL